jgi:CubicO group peptidase (beta-lactamase class C family)
MRRASVCLAVLAPGLLAMLGASPEAPKPDDAKTRVDAIFKEYDRSDSPGCALGVYRNGRIEYARGYGMANLELGIANSPQTVLDIGSTGKQFTALSIHLLASEGKLSLDDDVRKWIPEIPDYGQTVTVRNLLHHTGGLRDYIVLFDLQGVVAEDLSTREDTLGVLARQKAPNFAPGAEHLYSNTGYFLLGEIVRRASGQSLRDFAHDRIFVPLGMRHTQYNDSHTRLIPGRATGYSKAESGGFGIDMSDWEQVGDGGVLTSVEDLQRWDENFYSGAVGGRAVIDAMLVPGVLSSGKKLQYASALYVADYRGLPSVSHGGAWAGYRAQLLRFPKEHLSVACLCNLGDSNPSRLAHLVADVYLGDKMTKVPESAETRAAGAAARKPPRAAADAARLRALAGAYLDRSSDRFFRLAVENGELAGKWGPRRIVFVPVAPDRYRVEGLGEDVRVEAVAQAAASGRARVAVTIDDDGDLESLSFEPVEVWSPTPAELSALAGRYASAELDTSWRLEAKDGKLYLRYRGAPEDPLAPSVADRMSVGGEVLHFTRDASGQANGFTVDAGRVRGIAFRRMPAS